ncbi:MAG TPA: quinone oxidoreductase [Alphaproteobacteria bacterium]|nr:quinone oxidoreductase [Alphaproteobacteria bacterium]
MVKAIRISQPGGPEVLRMENVSLPEPGPGEALVRHHAVGLNYVDVYYRIGLYKQPSYPCGIGFEGAGVVEKVGPKVKEIKPGDRVAYGQSPLGAYAEARVMPAERLVKLPKEIDFKTGAAMMLQGMTVQYLIRRTYRIKKGETILLHAAAGGVGLILCQWAKSLGVTVIGTVGSDEKAKLAKAHGCKHPIVYTRDDFVAAVKKITKGEGVPVVYDSIGKDTFERSLNCLSPRGLMVTFGNASGPVPPFELGTLAAKGSLYITRPTLGTYVAKHEDLLATARDLFSVVRSGKVKIRVNQTYPLAQAAQAHRDLEARKTTGSTVLIP